jgi:hypothetical protein
VRGPGRRALTAKPCSSLRPAHAAPWRTRPCSTPIAKRDSGVEDRRTVRRKSFLNPKVAERGAPSSATAARRNMRREPQTPAAQRARHVACCGKYDTRVRTALRLHHAAWKSSRAAARRPTPSHRSASADAAC